MNVTVLHVAFYGVNEDDPRLHDILVAINDRALTLHLPLPAVDRHDYDVGDPKEQP